MKTLYLLRHGEKAWANGKKPSDVQGAQHDPPLKATCLKPEVAEQIRDVVFDKMYCSPFLRCRQTANQYIHELKKEPKFIIAKEIGEFLGNQRRVPIPNMLNESAAFYNPVEFKQLTTESIKRMKFRVKKFLDNLPDGTHLIITHGIIIKEISGKEAQEGDLIVHQI